MSNEYLRPNAAISCLFIAPSPKTAVASLELTGYDQGRNNTHDLKKATECQITGNPLTSGAGHLIWRAGHGKEQ